MSRDLYKIVNYGPMEKWDQHILKVPPPIKAITGFGEVAGKRFGKDDLDLCYMDFSINKIPPGMETPFVYSHSRQEEVYIILKGEGDLLIDGEVVAFSTGSAVRVDQTALRSIRNSSLTEPLYFIAVRAQDGKIADHKDDVKEIQSVDWDDFLE